MRSDRTVVDRVNERDARRRTNSLGNPHASSSEAERFRLGRVQMVRNEVAVAAAHRLRICVRRGWDGSFVRDRVDLRKLPTLDVAGSIPVARSLPKPPADGGFVVSGASLSVLHAVGFT